MKLISVIIPFYSNKKWLIEALESVKNQSYRFIEVIIIIDGSEEDVSHLEINYPDYLFVYKSNGGSASARNVGLSMAKGDYIAFLDSDDMWPKMKLEKQYKYMLENNSKVTYHSYYIFDDNNYENKKIVSFSKYKKNIWLRAFVSLRIQISTLMIHKDVVATGIKFPTEFKHGQDIEYFKDVSRLYDFENVNGLVSYFRVKSSNIGFDSGKQLKYKAQVCAKMVKDRLQLPKIIRVAYHLAVICNKINIYLNSNNNRFISNLLYLPHYSILKLIVFFKAYRL